MLSCDPRFHLRRRAPRHLAAGLGPVEVVAAAVDVERTEQSAAAHHLGERPEGRGRAFPLYQRRPRRATKAERSEEHTSELQSLMRISYAVFCLTNKKNQETI